MTDDDRIPVAEIYRGIGVHCDQSRDRVERVVKPSVDKVLSMNDVAALYDLAGDITQPPEARLLAGAKALAAFELAAEDRRVRPDIDLDRLRARVAGLDCRRWRHPLLFCSLLDTPPRPGARGAAARERPLGDD